MKLDENYLVPEEEAVDFIVVMDGKVIVNNAGWTEKGQAENSASRMANLWPDHEYTVLKRTTTTVLEDV